MSAYAQTVKNYTINTTAKTITFTDYTTIVLERIALITDITAGSIIYQFNTLTPATGTVATNVLTLSSMSGVNNTDKLRIDYTNLTGDPTYETPALPLGAATAANQVNGNEQVQGNVASGSTDSGNPVKVGGKYNSTLPTLTTGQRSDLQLDSSSRVLVQAPTATGTAIPANAFFLGLNNNGNLSGQQASSQVGDGNGASSTASVGPLVFNASSWDRIRSAIGASATTGTGLLGAGILGQYNSTLPTVTSGNVQIAQLDSNGRQILGTSTNTQIGTVRLNDSNGNGLGEVTAGDTLGNQTVTLGVTNFPELWNATTSQWGRMNNAPGAVASGLGSLAATPTPSNASLGLSPYFNASLSATATAVKTSSGRLHTYNVYNPNTTVSYLQMFNLATGSVSLGTTTPMHSIPIPPNSVWDGQWIYSDNWSTAITIAATTTNSGSLAPTNGLVVNLGYL